MGETKVKKVKVLLYSINLLFITLLLLNGYYAAVVFIFYFIILLFFNIFITINIHELGHFIFGKIYGFQLMAYQIGIFSWKKENGKMKLSIIKNKGYSGLCSMFPPKKEISNFKYVIFYSGGIIFNIVFGILFLIINSIYIKNVHLNILFNSSGIISIVIGASNLLPLMSGNNPTDGKVIWSILLKKPFAEKILIMKNIMAKFTHGVRPSMLDIPIVNTDNIESFDLYFILFLYFQALDNKDDDKILFFINLLEENIDKYPTPSLPGLYYEICFVGCITNDMKRALTYYNRAKNHLIKDKDTNGCRVKAYYEYFVNEDYNAALELCQQGLAVKDKFPNKGQGLMEEDLIIDLSNLINLK